MDNHLTMLFPNSLQSFQSFSCYSILWCHQRRQTDAFARLVHYATAHMYLAVARMLGICHIPDDSTVEVGMPLFEARGKSLCDHIVSMNKKTRTTWFPIFLRFLVSHLELAGCWYFLVTVWLVF